MEMLVWKTVNNTVDRSLGKRVIPNPFATHLTASMVAAWNGGLCLRFVVVLDISTMASSCDHLQHAAQAVAAKLSEGVAAPMSQACCHQKGILHQAGALMPDLISSFNLCITNRLTLAVPLRCSCACSYCNCLRVHSTIYLLKSV